MAAEARKGAPEGQTAYELSEAESAEVLAILVECGAVRVVGKEGLATAPR